MEVDWNIEFLGPRKKRPIGYVIIESTLVVIVDEGADETELLDSTSQFVGRGGWVRDWDCRPATEAGWMLADCCSKDIVRILALRKIHGSSADGEESGAHFGVSVVCFEVPGKM